MIVSIQVRFIPYSCTIPFPVIVLLFMSYTCNILLHNFNSTELHQQGVAPRSQYSDHMPEAVTLQ